MQKWFNTAGPCKADIHYMLSATERLPAIKQLIAQELTASGPYISITQIYPNLRPQGKDLSSLRLDNSAVLKLYIY